jgi:HNH endonuclease
MSGRLRLAPSVRAALERRCGGACEGCGLEWRWALYVFRLEETSACTAPNLVVLCSSCSASQGDEFAPLVGERSLRDRLLTANNRRAGVKPLTARGRRALIAARGGVCEVCGAKAAERGLQVHHRLAVLQGGDDGENNLQVLCFVCHHHLQPCATGCGAWAKKRSGICRNCEIRSRLEQLTPSASWEQIKARYPSFVSQWKPGYEPQSVVGCKRLETVSAGKADSPFILSNPLAPGRRRVASPWTASPER